MVQIQHIIAGALLIANSLLAAAVPRPPPFIELKGAARLRRGETAAAAQPQFNLDFPDPAVIKVGSTWYAFATNSNGKHVQAAEAPHALGPWTWLDIDLLPDGGWTTGNNTWAPDVRRLDDGTFVMYYSGEAPGGGGRHCIGVAISRDVLGPYTPQATPFACPLDRGGAIDASGFLDTATRRRYVVYKVDGNNLGHGGECNNLVAPIESTPILLQEVAADGMTPIGAAVQILDRSDEDGPLVEAPDLVRAADGTYVLFYSSHCFTSPEYVVRYAKAATVAGPYVKAAAPLLRTGVLGLTAPGGATSAEEGGALLYHADCAEGRCLFVADYTLQEGMVVLT